MSAETLPMNRMIDITMRPGATTSALRLIVRECLAHHPPAGSHEHEKERPQELGEQPAPFSRGVSKVFQCRGRFVIGSTARTHVSEPRRRLGSLTRSPAAPRPSGEGSSP